MGIENQCFIGVTARRTRGRAPFDPGTVKITWKGQQ